MPDAPPVAWIVTRSYEYAGSEILKAFASQASALALAAAEREGDKCSVWGDAETHEGSTTWHDGFNGTLAVERHELAP